jgi:hypothetical protein
MESEREEQGKESGRREGRRVRKREGVQKSHITRHVRST